MPNYILAQASNKANIADTVWYAMETSDLADLQSEQHVSFGDKAYVIKSGKMAIFGNDEEWYWLNDTSGASIDTSDAEVAE